MLSDPTVLILMYFILPVWLAAGFSDWLCHRTSHIKETTGAKESLIHLLMFAEVGVPLLAAMFLEINALIIAVMIAAFFIHEGTVTLFGGGTEKARFILAWKPQSLPIAYIASVMTVILLFEFLPYVEEFVRETGSTESQKGSARADVASMIVLSYFRRGDKPFS